VTKTQQDKVRAHLLRGKSITPIQALKLYGCFRLSSIIFRLRREGLNIVTGIVYKGGKQWARYVL